MTKLAKINDLDKKLHTLCHGRPADTYLEYQPMQVTP